MKTWLKSIEYAKWDGSNFGIIVDDELLVNDAFPASGEKQFVYTVFSVVNTRIRVSLYAYGHEVVAFELPDNTTASFIWNNQVTHKSSCQLDGYDISFSLNTNVWSNNSLNVNFVMYELSPDGKRSRHKYAYRHFAFMSNGDVLNALRSNLKYLLGGDSYTGFIGVPPSVGHASTKLTNVKGDWYIDDEGSIHMNSGKK